MAYGATLATETVYDVHTDHLDTPRALTDPSGVVRWRAAYQAFGTASLDEDPDGDLTDVTFNVRFPGQYADAESGLHYNRFRYYSPELGRYLNADPIGQAGGVNVFGYAGQNPTGLIDPSGLAIPLPIALIGALVAGAGATAWVAATWDEMGKALDRVVNWLAGAVDAIRCKGQILLQQNGEEEDEIPPELQEEIDAEEAALDAFERPPAPHPPNPPAPDVDETQDISESIERAYPDNPQRRAQQRIRDAIQREVDKSREE